MDGAIRIAVVVFLLRGTYAGFCSRPYTCQGSCKTYSKYYTSCGLWQSCTRYRTAYKQCAKTCYRNVCCPGYSGSNCDIPSCFGSYLCPNGGKCRYPDICSCLNGFAPPKCEDIDECSSSTHGCQHDCVNNHGSYNCTCRSGFTLDTDLKSCLDLNECLVNNSGCSHTCNNNNGSFSCSCWEGYKLNTDEKTCDDLNECSLGTAECTHNCTNTEGSYTCSCNEGYTLGVDGHLCEDVDECADGTAKCEGYCNNTIGSYTCYCSPGFILDDNGFSCKDINECETGNEGCDHLCINEPGSYRCECRKGFMSMNSSTNSEVCEDIDECMESGAICSQICNNTVGSYSCSCNTGFILGSDSTSCKDIDDCEGVVCMNEGTCTDGLNKYTCICKTGYRGKYCETDINECEFANGGCQDVCTNTDGSFYCSCLEDRQLKDNGISCFGGELEKQNVFERLKIPRQMLPKPCFTVTFVECIDGNDNIIFLSSTSEWYKLSANHNVMFTYGIVFVKVNNFFVPISLKGMEVSVQGNKFTLSYRVLYKLIEGTMLESERSNDECTPFEPVASDVFDFISMDSFMKTYFYSLFPTIPSWLRFGKSRNEMLSIQDTESFLVYGRDLEDDSWCQGAPVISDHLYTIFKFNTGFKIIVFGDAVDIPKPVRSRRFCLIVDLCQHNGGTVFLMIPEGSRDMFTNIDIFQALKNKQNLHIRPRGIGISLSDGISANYHTFSGQLWNGDKMFTPYQPNMNFWIGGTATKYDQYFTVEGNFDIYFGVPSVETMFTSMFVEEWTGLIDVQFSLFPELRFKLFGIEHKVTFSMVSSKAIAYISFGGSNRQWCGDISNPEGLFLSIVIDSNPFKGIPFLEDFVFPVIKHVLLFAKTGPQENPLVGIQLNIKNNILQLDNVLNKTTDILDDAINSVEIAFSNTFKATISEIKHSFNMIKKMIHEDVATVNLIDIIKYFEDIRKVIDIAMSKINVLVDEFAFLINVAKDNFIKLLEFHGKLIEDIIRNIQVKITNTTTSIVGSYTSFGLRFTSDFKFLGLNFEDLELEMVYSNDDLFTCSGFEDVKKLMSGEKALRVLGKFVSKKQLGFFLNYKSGLGFAFSSTTYNVLLQFQAHVKMLGIKMTIDVVISLKSGIYFYLEGNVWGTFLAEIDVVAEVGKDWDELSFNLRGKFVGKERKRRDLVNVASSVKHHNLNVHRIRRQEQTEGSSFQDFYQDALKKGIQLISDEAQKRITQVQNALTSAQKSFVKAQDWLINKRNDVREANMNFNKAVKRLEEKKQQLEHAKGPLQKAIKELEKAERDINNLCKIKKCNTFCIPGIKCRTCKKKIGFAKISFICCKFSRCMLSFPDPVCVLKNKACRIIRAAAYLVLSKATIFVRTAMFDYDIAIEAVSFAQFAVDKSRAVLFVSEGVLELAETGLSVASDILAEAKVALEAVKVVIGTATKVLQYVTQYGLKNVIDVKNCGFDIVLSTKDLPVFEVACEVNAFELGWKEIKLKINFKNMHQSIWQAARATIKAIIDISGGIFSGRKRRDIEFEASLKTHILLRKIRDSENINNTLYNLNKTIDLSKNISGFRESGDSDFESRVELFREKCAAITLIQDFMHNAFAFLQAVVNESIADVGEIDNVKNKLKEFNNMNVTLEDMTGASIGISSEYAARDYNMTEDDIDKAINDTKVAASEDPLLMEIHSAVHVMRKGINDEIESAEKIDFRSTWFISMRNMTGDYFNESECKNFQDCMFYSISKLYVLYESEDLENISNIQKSILGLENSLIEIFQNESSSMDGISAVLEDILSYVNILIDMNLFCSEAPKFVKQLQNQTVLYGSNVTFFCNVTGSPNPDFIWFKNDSIIQGESFNVLTVSNVTEIDSYDKYNCMAGNVVANLTSSDAYIAVVLQDIEACADSSGQCEEICLNFDGTYSCVCPPKRVLSEDLLPCEYAVEHTENMEEGLNIVLIVVPILGSVAFVVAILLIVCILLKRKNWKKWVLHIGKSTHQSAHQSTSFYDQKEQI